MNYDKYKTETVREDRTVLGNLGLNESTVASIKGGAKAAAGFAVSGASTVLEAAKVVTPGIAHAAAAGANVGLIARDQVAVNKTEAHIHVLQEIQNDLAKTRALCTCDHCPEVVGYAITQKTKKFERKQDRVAARAVSAASPVPLPLNSALTAASTAHAAQKQYAGTRGVERNRQAGVLHLGARGVCFHGADGGKKFVNGCPVARAIIDELTGHWERWVYADDGADHLATKLKSK